MSVVRIRLSLFCFLTVCITGYTKCYLTMPTLEVALIAALWRASNVVYRVNTDTRYQTRATYVKR